PRPLALERHDEDLVAAVRDEALAVEAPRLALLRQDALGGRIELEPRRPRDRERGEDEPRADHGAPPLGARADQPPEHGTRAALASIHPRSSRFRILPVGPFGRLSTTATMRGYLYAASRSLQ